jgi:Fanconi-associated nuclease 1
MSVPVYHNSLQRRIVRLESALGVPADERHPPVPGLRAAKKRIMKGEKLSEGETGKKSSWRAMDGAEISVEALALECYNKEGWKGFHSENGILTTIVSNQSDHV